jgi:hypothetical protein
VGARIVRSVIKFRTRRPPEIAGEKGQPGSQETTKEIEIHSDFLDSWFPDSGQKNPDVGNFNEHTVNGLLPQAADPEDEAWQTPNWHKLCNSDRGVFTPRHRELERPLVVHLTRMAGLLTLFGGIVLLIAASPAIGVAVVLLSALYFALAEIISYLAVIAHNSRGPESFFEDEEIQDEVDVTSR